MVTGYHAKFVGGRLCLDFVNTVGGRARGVVIRDKIGSYGDLLAWSRLAGTIDGRSAGRLGRVADGEPREVAAVLRRAFDLREALYRVMRSVSGRRRVAAGDLETIQGEVEIARGKQRLERRDSGFGWVFAAAGESLDRVVWPVALSAAELLTSGDLGGVRECGGPECGWLFLDTSRNHSRRWCDMQDCGNRAKVRRFREKGAVEGL